MQIKTAFSSERLPSRKKILNTGKDVGIGEPIFTAAGIVNL